VFRFCLSVLTLALSCSAAQASIVITGTRVIYPSDAKEVSVKVSNKGQAPVLIQSWLDTGDATATPDQIKVPFILTPPINRVEPQSGQTLRIRGLPNTLPSDRESLFWLNVLEIPAQPKAEQSGKNNYLQVAFRSRIKFFWRPAGLKGSLTEAVKGLQWGRGKQGLHVHNPSPYYISLVSVSTKGKTADGKMVAPFSDDDYALPAAGSVTGEYISDYGAVMPLSSNVQ
jgi:chaperone protein EcpD